MKKISSCSRWLGGGCVTSRQGSPDLGPKKALGAWLESLVGLTRVTLIPRSPFRSRGPFQITHGRNVAAGAAEAEPPLTGLYKTHNSYGPATSKSSTLPHPHPPLNQKKKRNRKRKEKEKEEKKKNPYKHQWLPLPTSLLSWTTVARRLVVEITTAQSAVFPLLVLLHVCHTHSLSHHIIQSTHTSFRFIFSLNPSPHSPSTCRCLLYPHQCFPWPIGGCILILSHRQQYNSSDS